MDFWYFASQPWRQLFAGCTSSFATDDVSQTNILFLWGAGSRKVQKPAAKPLLAHFFRHCIPVLLPALPPSLPAQGRFY